MPMKIPLLTQSDLFAIATPPPKLSDEERLKAIALLRCLLSGVRRDKAALSSGCKSHPAKRSSRKQPEQLWR